MKRDFLKELGIDEDKIDKIMAENGKDINSRNAEIERLKADGENYKNNLDNANATLEKFKDYEQTKADVEKYKSELEKSKSDYEAKIKKMERTGKIKDFISGYGRKFINEETKSYYSNALSDELDKDENRKIDEVFESLIKDKENIFIAESPKPPKIVKANGDTVNASADDNAIRRIMGLPIKK